MDILENMRKMLEAGKISKEDIERAFPELKESEDERTRKYIITRVMEENISHYLRELIIAYLEKHKPYELTEEDRKIIPEALVMLCNDIINHRVHTPISTDEEGARKIKAFLKTFNRKPHKTKEEWEVQKEDERIRKAIISAILSGRVYDTDLVGAEHIFELDKEVADKWIAYLEKQKEQKPVECIEDSVKFKEGFKAGRESGLRDGQKYVLNNLDSYGLCKSAEWGEDDEQFLLVCKNALQKYQSSDKWDAAIIYSWLEKRLKSLRPQPHWKPSEEQMEALEIACNLTDDAREHIMLSSLYEQLKSL